MRPVFRNLAAMLMTCAAVMPGTAMAASSPLSGRSVLVLCYEQTDGNPTGSCVFEGELLSQLRARGAVLVDLAQAERLRKQYAPSTFHGGADLKGIDLLDAELGLVIDVRSSEQARLGNIQSHLVQISIKVIDPSRAAIVFTHDASLTAPGLSAQQALVEAAKKFYAKQGAGVMAALENSLAQAAMVELWIYDLNELSQVSAVEKALGASGLCTSLKQLNFGKGLAKWRVTLAEGKNPQDLAQALEQAELLLATQGMTGSMVQLARDPVARVKLAVLVETQADRGVPTWFRDGMVDLAAHRFLTEGWIEIVRDRAQPHMARVQVRAHKVKRGAYRLDLQLADDRGKKISAVTESAAEPDLAEAVGRGSVRLLEALRVHLAKHPGAYSELQRALAAERAVQVRVLLTEAEEVLDGAHFARYQKDGLGTIRVEPRLDEASARARLINLTEFGPWSTPSSSGELRLEFPPTVAESSLLASAEQPLPVQLEVELRGRIGERMYTTRAQRALVYWPADLVPRDRPQVLVRFVTPQDPGIRQLGTTLSAGAGASPSRPLAQLGYIWDALGRYHLVYSPSGTDSTQLIHVQTPAATLASHGGDEDDLVMLFASLLEAAGVSTCLVVASDTLLLAVDTGLPINAWPLLVERQSEVLVRGDALYAVLDPTARDEDLWNAIQRGGIAFQRAGAKALLLDPREGWAQEPAVAWRVATPTELPAQAPRVKVMVLDLPASNLGPDLSAHLTMALAAQISRIGAFDVLTTDELKTLLTVEARRQLIGCNDDGCLTELANAAGSRFVVHGKLAHLPKRTVLDLVLLDTEKAQTRARQNLEVADVQALDARLPATAYRLMKPALAAVGATCSDDRAWASHIEDLGAARAHDSAWERARFYALASQLDQAEDALRSVQTPALRALGQAHLSLLRGRFGEAREKYQALHDERAEQGAQLAGRLEEQAPPMDPMARAQKARQAAFMLEW